MIVCNNLKKKYGKQIVLNDFNYFFKNNGLYLLFGRSGSGKSTLLNILSGLTPFDEGTIKFEKINKRFTKKVENKIVNDYIAYISQNIYFVDYLDIYSNLCLCSSNQILIKKLLKEFNLTDLSKKMPSQLSGGEKQRIAIIQALLMDKSILLLDEPTSSLDKENRNLFFKMLEHLKKDVLIIVSSHDERLKEHSDYIIDFNDLKKYQKKVEEISSKDCCNTNVNLKKERNFKKIFFLLKYMSKEYSNSRFEKKYSLWMTIVFLISMAICFLCSNPRDKLYENISKLYKVNQLYVECNAENTEICNNIFKESVEMEKVIIYSRNIPEEWRDASKLSGKSIESTFLTLPFDKKWFKLSEKILYGNYFQNKNDIILSYEYANSISDGDVESLIGKKVYFNMGKTTEEFVICGVFQQFDKLDFLYFQAQNVYSDQLEYNAFLNSKFTSEYFNNELVEYFVIYFNNFTDMNKIYNKYYDKESTPLMSYPSLYVELINSFETVSFILYPLAFIAIIVSLIFYYQFSILKLEYYKYNFCVYNYYGYDLKEVSVAHKISALFHMFKLLNYALIIALGLCILGNFINSTLKFYSFRLFSFNFNYILIFYFIILLVCYAMSNSFSRKIEKLGWYKMLEESRDLL